MQYNAIQYNTYLHTYNTYVCMYMYIHIYLRTQIEKYLNLPLFPEPGDMTHATSKAAVCWKMPLFARERERRERERGPFEINSRPKNRIIAQHSQQKRCKLKCAGRWGGQNATNYRDQISSFFLLFFLSNCTWHLRIYINVGVNE